MKSYKPLITESQARELLTIRGRILRFRKIIPYRVELIYLPYFFFKILVQSKKGEERTFTAAIDRILGSFALVDEKLMEAQEQDRCEFQPVVTMEQAKESLVKEARWFLYHKSSRSRERYTLKDTGPGEAALYPFWVAYYQNKGGAWEFLGLDAVSGVLQGGSARRIFIHAFADNRIKTDQKL